MYSHAIACDLRVVREVAPAAMQCKFRSGLEGKDVDAALRQAIDNVQHAEGNALLWYCEAKRRQVYADFGFPAMREYAMERLSLSKNLAARYDLLAERLRPLPRMLRALAEGDVEWTKIQVLVQVATPENELAWIDRARNTGRRGLRRQVAEARHRAGRPTTAGAIQGTLGAEDGGARGGRASAELELAEAGAKRQEMEGRAACDFGPGLAMQGSSSGLKGGGGVATNHLTEAGARDEHKEASGAVRQQAGATTVARQDGPILAAPDEDLPGVPMTVQLRFSPMQFARYEAVREKLHKNRVVRAGTTREDMFLDALDALLEAEGRRVGSAQAAEVVTHAKGAGAPRKGLRPNPVEESAHVSGRNPLRRPADSGGAKPRDVNRPGGPISDPNPVRAVRAGTSSPERTDNAGQAGSRDPKRTGYHIVIYQCGSCGKSHVMTSRGPRLLSRAEQETVSCDAIVERSGDRRRSTIPQRIRRAVFRRDGHQCRVRGCGQTRYLEVHHKVARAQGGFNRLDNLVTLCSRCHRHWHEKGWDSHVLRPLEP